MQPEDYMSFLVRLWRNQPGADRPGGWRGELELIQTGARWSFCTHAELLAFLQWLTIAQQVRPCPASETPTKQ